jgi:hypothetical protein
LSELLTEALNKYERCRYLYKQIFTNKKLRRFLTFEQ